ncbi:30S ribosome-binding factor RbfA [Pseudanabaena sp. FACHB-2040]|uniref:30S ribosome-binding factor RbfA n=1 Tax=Pseudanabaena sp. FACHB-2040 TaxID=2692859 RepID=UPI001684EAD3|nr:30S ribosome-binding factor RbfA [Pseudanabaena sp. FACHB-2040]MBD0269859.1 30S ribosome-binding factor RbfA [Cyanobacteria bacterium Co-bin8]MBD2257504.1 30S ribosome-binding factor RbfA [Pseudanabaena sp. FACHB-2040]
MPNDRRMARVASLIKREVSQMLVDGIKDDRVGAGMVSVTDVDVSGDLQHAKIFVSIYGTDEARAETMEGLGAATGFVRSEIGKRIRLRRTPEILFKEDRSVERGTQVLSLLNQLSQERAEKGDPDLESDAENGLQDSGGTEEDLFLSEEE